VRYVRRSLPAMPRRLTQLCRSAESFFRRLNASPKVIVTDRNNTAKNDQQSPELLLDDAVGWRDFLVFRPRVIAASGHTVEIFPDQLSLPVAHLLEVLGQRILTDRLGRQIKILDLGQLDILRRRRLRQDAH